MIEVTINNLPEINLVCVRGLIRSGSKISREIIPDLWQKIRTQQIETSRYDDNRYAIITGDLLGREESETHYFAGFRVETCDVFELPEDFFYYKIAEGRIATTIHTGSPMMLGQTAIKLFRDWLPQSNRTLRLNRELIVYSSDYDRNDPKSEFEYSIFLN